MKPIQLCFLWHMHQPQYRTRGRKSCFLPWVRLHAVRGYYDMVRALEDFPKIRATFNLVPAMLEQIEAYNQGESDAFLDILTGAGEEYDDGERQFLFDHFFSAQADQMIRVIPHYGELLARKNQLRVTRGMADAWRDFTASEYADLRLLFDLAWFGFKARDDFPVIDRLRQQGTSFSASDISEIVEAEKTILNRMIPLYRDTQARGQIEISCSPYAHPILSLLIDSDSAREAIPHATLPPPFRHPGDARRQVVEALEFMEKRFGKRPQGIWPSEGSVSQDTAALLAECGIRWAASDEEVLARSQREGPSNPHQIWESSAGSQTLSLLFRDRDLSDRISFNYARRAPEEAAHDFVQTLIGRCELASDGSPTVLVALDGENPWEHFPNAGADFIRHLYAEISKQPVIQCVTIGEAVERATTRPKIRRLHAGSWIYGNFGTWIGGPEKNRAWSILERVRSELEPFLNDASVSDAKRAKAWASLRSAEGSDWFWWLDGQFVSTYRAQFDETFRAHLTDAYEALEKTPPDFLTWFVPAAQHREEGAAREPFQWLSPRVDGFESDLFEWFGALKLPWSALSSAGAMYETWRPIRSLHLGFSEGGDFLLRLDPVEYPATDALRNLQLELAFRIDEAARTIRIRFSEAGDLLKAELVVNGSRMRTGTKAVSRKIVEISLPCEEIGLLPGKSAVLRVTIESGARETALREVVLTMPDQTSLLASEGTP